MKKFLACICALMFAFSSHVFASTGYVSVVRKIKDPGKHHFKHGKIKKIIEYKYESTDDGTAVVKNSSGEILFEFKNRVIFDSTHNKIADYSERCVYNKVNRYNTTMIELKPSGEIFENRYIGGRYESFKRGRIAEGSTTKLSAIYKKKSKICQFDNCIPKVIAVFVSLLEDLNLVEISNSSDASL